MDKRKRPEPVFRTHAIMDEASKTTDAGVLITTRNGVKDAKQFVEENQK